jgi:hypothetical protein
MQTIRLTENRDYQAEFDRFEAFFSTLNLRS